MQNSGSVLPARVAFSNIAAARAAIWEEDFPFKFPKMDSSTSLCAWKTSVIRFCRI